MIELKVVNKVRIKEKGISENQSHAT